MKWYLFTMVCFAHLGPQVCDLDVRFGGRAYRAEAECERAAGLLGRAVADIGGRQMAYSCVAADNLDAAILSVLGQRRS